MIKVGGIVANVHEPDWVAAEDAARWLLFQSSLAISCAHGTYGVTRNVTPTAAQAAKVLSVLDKRLHSNDWRIIHDAAKWLEGKAEPCTLSVSGGTSMFDATVNLAQKISSAACFAMRGPVGKVAITVRDNCEAIPEGVIAIPRPLYDKSNVMEHWEAIRNSLRNFPEFNLDEAQAKLRVEVKRHTQADDEIPPLSERKYLILQTLLVMKATSADSRQTTARVATRAEGLAAQPVQFKKDVAELKADEFIETKRGTGGGCWLTAKGLNLANRLNR